MNTLISHIFPKVKAAGADITISTKGANEVAAFKDLGTLVNFVINLVFGVGLSLALLFVIIGGIKYITSQGDEGKATEARNTITNAVIGAVVIIAFRVLINLALNVLGLDEGISAYFSGGSRANP